MKFLYYRSTSPDEVQNFGEERENEKRFFDTEDFNTNLTPELQKMIDLLETGDFVYCHSFSELGYTPHQVIASFEKLVKKNVSLFLIDVELYIEPSQMKNCLKIIRSFYDADLHIKSLEKKFNERKRVKQAKEAAELSGERLRKAMLIATEYFQGSSVKELTEKYQVSSATVYRYKNKYGTVKSR